MSIAPEGKTGSRDREADSSGVYALARAQRQAEILPEGVRDIFLAAREGVPGMQPVRQVDDKDTRAMPPLEKGARPVEGLARL